MRTVHIISLTIHISMTSTFQCAYSQCFTFKRCDKSKLKWLVISTYTLRCSLSAIHARGSIQLIHLSGLCSPIRVMPNDQKQSEGSFVPAEVGQTSSGDSGGNSAAVDQVFSMFKDFVEKKLEEKEKQIEQRSMLDKEVV